MEGIIKEATTPAARRLECARAFKEYCDADPDRVIAIDVKMFGYTNAEHFREELSELAPDLLASFSPAFESND